MLKIRLAVIVDTASQISNKKRMQPREESRHREKCEPKIWNV